MNKTTEALKLAEEALEKVKKMFRSMTADESPDDTYIYVGEALAAIREALAEKLVAMILNDPHPPHRLCECTACLEYWTPLPDCDAFAASGKPKADPVKQEPVGELVLVHRKVLNKLGIDDEVINIVARTPAQQEPVATEHPLVAYAESYEQIARSGSSGKVSALAVATDIRQNMIPLTAAPVSAKREWVDLTDDELKAALEVHQVGLSVWIGRIAIAAFKEKNK